ncbi:MAG: cobalamin-binding domain-containing protein [Desulfobacteraceae bacterium]|nr:MAG: cobalamin-binding domain-containing protein [Desulfobacteraceae bacterium]
MSNILLVEPDYRSKFPPLGLMRISTYHKERGDCVTFVRGRSPEKREMHWHRVYISSLFTWELPRTVKTILYYSKSVTSLKDIFVGGIGATLQPEYIKKRVECTVIEGQIEKRGVLGQNSPPIAHVIPDYSILNSVDYNYEGANAYFVRITKGCVRNCKFCAVPKLEPEFGLLAPLEQQTDAIKKVHGVKQNLIVMDNNVLAVEGIKNHLRVIEELGFTKGSKLNNRERTVDFNQGIDARLIAAEPELSEALGRIPVKPIRLAFDFVSPRMERDYCKAITLLSKQGFSAFTTYLLYNYNDTPEQFYNRLRINTDLNEKLGIRISGFPMRYIPISDTKRGYVSSKWKWRWLRGIQCVLQATRGLVSPNSEFVQAAFGKNTDEFFEILSMPDRYIVYREHYKTHGAKEWLRKFRSLSVPDKNEFLELLERLNKDGNRKQTIATIRKYRSLIEHYYPNGETAPHTPEEEQAIS